MTLVALLLIAAVHVAPPAAAASTASLRASGGPLLLAELRDPEGLPGDGFGYSVGISPHTVVIGEPGFNGVGHVYIYEQSASGWPRTPTVTLTDPAGLPRGTFGWSVALSGPTLVVGDYQFSSTSGIAYVYSHTSSGWPASPTVTLHDPEATGGDGFGVAVAVSGNTALVGAYGAGGPFPGAAYLYSRAASGWPASPTATLPNPGPPRDLFALSVALSGATAVVGACGCGAPGYPGFAYIYSRGTSGWPSTPTISLYDPVSTQGDLFGASLTVSGDTMIIGAAGTDSYRGAAYIYTKTQRGWSAIPSITLADRDIAEGGYFGLASVDQGTAIISEYGRAYVYFEKKHGWPRKPNELVTNPGGKRDGFASSKAILDSIAVMGAPATNGNVGAAYIYQV